MLRCSFALLVTGLLACLGGFGCGSPEPTPQHVARSFQNLRIIKSAYLKATNELNRPPQNLEDLMPYLKASGDPAKILRSPEDGQEYKILWNVDIINVQGKLPIIAYEQRGKDGMRYVLEAKEVRRMSDEEFKQAPFPPGYKAPP
jgi:hypothetical protein